MSHNKITGSLPIFNGLTELNLDLSDNNFKGTLIFPDFKDINLLDLDLSNNQFTGQIPDFDFNFMNVSTLNLANNQFTGQIPNIKAQSLLLDLSHNQLTGSIPEFSAVNTLSLSLANNQLSGSIPNFKQTFIGLNLANNQLTGTVPSTLSKKISLLWLYGNQLTGTLPSIFTANSSLSKPLDKRTNYKVNRSAYRQIDFPAKDNLLGLSPPPDPYDKYELKPNVFLPSTRLVVDSAQLTNLSLPEVQSNQTGLQLFLPNASYKEQSYEAYFNILSIDNEIILELDNSRLTETAHPQFINATVHSEEADSTEVNTKKVHSKDLQLDIPLIYINDVKYHATLEKIASPASTIRWKLLELINEDAF